MKNTTNLDLKSVLKQLRNIVAVSQRYMVVAFIVILVGLYGFLILQISQASQKEPSQDQVTAELGTVKRLHIDQDSIDKILQLKDQNIEVQSLFKNARDNPFSEKSDGS